MTQNPHTGQERQAGSVGYEECIGTWDAGSSPSAATIASLCLCCLVYQLFSGLASSPWITCYLSSLVRLGLLGSVSDDLSNPRSNYLILIARQCLVVLPTLFNMISGVHLPDSTNATNIAHNHEKHELTNHNGVDASYHSRIALFHSNVSSCTTVVDPTSSSPAASPPHSFPNTSPMIPPNPLLYCTSRPHLADSSNVSSFDEPSPTTIISPSVGNAPPLAQPTYGFYARPLQHIDRYGYSSAALHNTTYRDAMLIPNSDMRWQRRLLLLNAPTRGISFPFFPMLIPSLVSCKWVYKI